LCRIFREYGEERFAKKIAHFIYRVRQKRPIETTQALASLVASAIARSGLRIHPATRVFQALRITVNQELEMLKLFLQRFPAILKAKGRIAIISYHSLEDRMVKHAFRQLAREGLGKIITKKPIVPQAAEIEANPRSRSAKLRAWERS